MKIKNLAFYIAFSFLTFGCASTNQDDDKPAVNLKAAVSEAASLRKSAEKDQVDLLAYKDYTNGTEYLKKAQKGLDNDYRSEFIDKNAMLAKGSFKKAIKLSGVRSANATRILKARKSSLDAGLKRSPKLVSKLTKVDGDVRDETSDFSDALTPLQFSKFQKQYFGLEIGAIQFRELGSIQNSIQKSARADADDRAPKALNTALLDFNDAENVIAQSPRDPLVYKASVKEALASSVLLADMMEVIKGAPGTPENIALKIVMQNRELGKLSKNVGQLEKNLEDANINLEATRTDLKQTEGALKLKDAKLLKTSTQVRFQNAMNEALKQFPEDQAAVYQQGSNLIFRLKKINFASGSSYIPSASKPLLMKVNKIITTLVGAELVVVQGHTDSVGATEQNQVLSTNRAIAVSNYLTSLDGAYKVRYAGFGESRPIASNETPLGRAINRRVDLVITAKK